MTKASYEVGDLVAFKPDSRHPARKDGKWEVVGSLWRGEHVSQICTLRSYPVPTDTTPKFIYHVAADHLVFLDAELANDDGRIHAWILEADLAGSSLLCPGDRWPRRPMGASSPARRWSLVFPELTTGLTGFSVSPPPDRLRAKLAVSA